MNKLYTGLIALVIGAGCDDTPIENSYQPPQIEYCTTENAKIAKLEQKLRDEAVKAQQESAKVKAESQTTCDTRVKAVEDKYNKKTEVAEKEKPKFPDMNISLHPLIKGLAQGKYDSFDIENNQDEEKPTLYIGYIGDGWYSASHTEDCSKGMKRPKDVSKEESLCSKLKTVAYNAHEGEFKIEVLESRTVESKDKETKEVYADQNLEGVIYHGLGQNLVWDEVTKVEISSKETGYKFQEHNKEDLAKEVADKYKLGLQTVVKSLYDSMEKGLAKKQTFPAK